MYIIIYGRRIQSSLGFLFKEDTRKSYSVNRLTCLITVSKLSIYYSYQTGHFISKPRFPLD